MDAYIALRGSNNITELADVPTDRMKLVAKKMRPVQDQRVKKTKWVVLRWPTPSMAQLAGMSTEAFEDFYFDVCTLDYRKLQPGMKALKSADGENRSGGDQGPGNRSAFQHQGNRRDHLRRRSQHSRRRSFQLSGERFGRGPRHFQRADAFTRASASMASGSIFAKAKSSRRRATKPKKLNEILDSDPGARYIGEFSLGFNPYILRADARHSFRREDRGLVPLHARARLTRKRTTAIAARSIGTWSASSGRITAAAKFTSTAN